MQQSEVTRQVTNLAAQAPTIELLWLCKKLGYADEAKEDFKKFNEIHDAHHHISP